jgi:hypothetical protein
MKRRIGIPGAISHESTIAYDRQLPARYCTRCHDAYYPEINIYSLDFQRFTGSEDRGVTDGSRWIWHWQTCGAWLKQIGLEGQTHDCRQSRWW